MQDKIKSYIFTSCKSIFTSLDMGLLSESDLELIATSDDENKLILKKIDDNELMGQIRVQLFIEFYLGKQKHKNPCFEMNLDFKLERAEVLSFESDLFPKIKLNVYTEVNGNKYKNIIAEQDLEMLCFNWLKQLNEFNYRPLCVQKV